MATNLSHVLTRTEAIATWENVMLPEIQEAYERDGEPDYIARSEDWNNWTDMLCQDGQISDWQYENWTHPDSCGA
tara:strand:+ start:499 stop:723 length:225 start_codon:yes stop_codon:yes gene_type:complete